MRINHGRLKAEVLAVNVARQSQMDSLMPMTDSGMDSQLDLSPSSLPLDKHTDTKKMES